ncbi:MAG: hypothetical protein HOP33_10735, partial [Verrucomicrobia bacterium]|nr:hypothetical protein [Verrucomicrobiota bacterium]
MKLLFKLAGNAYECFFPRLALLAVGILLCGGLVAEAQGAQPVVAIHDSEYTRALENINASGATPSGGGTTGKEWWTTDWHYFVMPEAVKEALKSDGTKFTVLGDSNIISGALLTNGLPKYPIVISLASEAILDSEIAQFTNYVAAGGFLFIGSSAFTRNTNGTARGDFAFATEMGVHSFNSALNNWVQNSTYARQGSHRINTHIPGGTLTWRLPSSSEEIPWGTNPTRVYQQAHDVWRVVNSNATVIAQGDSSPFLTVKQYGQGYFIYCSAMQPLLGNGGWAPTMYAYLTLRRSIEWAFETANVPVMKISPWPFQYDAAYMVRHDLENLSNEIAGAHSSALMEYTNGARGDYYFCTGTLREDMSGAYNTNTVINNLRGAISTNGATMTTHQGGLKNANNLSLTRSDYDYWHWGTDEVLDITPAGYSSGSNYAYSSLSLSFQDIESWFSGLMTNGMRIWCSPYFDATREGSMNIQSHLNVKIAGEQKVAPFPHWTLSTVTPNKRFSILSEPLSDWFVGSQISHSMEAGHNTSTVRAEVDFYYNLGALINQYSHTLSTGLGPSGSTATDYLLYTTDTNRFPRLWLANGIGIYNWWLQRSNVQITANYTTNDNQFSAQFGISGSTSTNTAVELITPVTFGFCNLQVFTNGVLAPTNIYRTQGQLVRLRVGTTVTNATINYYPQSPAAVVFSENFDALSTPSLPAGWSTSASGSQSAWVTQSAVADTAPNAAFSANASNVGVNELVTPAINLSPGQAVIAFRNNYNMEAGSGGVGYDGGVLEVKIGTNAYQDIIVAGGSFVSGGYNSLIDSGFGNALSNRQAWSGSSGGFITTVANLPTLLSNSVVKFRWRCGTDDGGVSGTGWRIDGVVVTNLVCNCCVVGTNSPTLPAQTNRTVDELSSLSVTNTATDADMPNDFLNYTLQNAPAGVAIDSNGVITWTPSESQGPSTNNITTIVTDSGGRTATNSFSVIVNEVNSAPTLPVQGNRSVSEMTTLTVTNAASDSDLPANSLTYMLIAAPVGAIISTNGVITWTPLEAQGPGTNTITTTVSDGALSATNSFTVTVNEVNVAPVFVGTPTNRTVAELATLTVTNNATDADVPANTLTYSLQNPPGGAVISTNGVITWTPTETQGPSTNTFTTIVSDGLVSATNSFVVTVTEVNVGPVFVGTPTNRTIAELTILTVTNNATDVDAPTNALTYSLQNPPSGAVISTNGVINWTPMEAQGPSTNTITTIVSDGALSVTNSFVVTVTEVNVAPVFVVTPTNRTIAELATLTVTNNATDADVPSNTLAYSLQNPPSGAVISTNGVITWTPTEGQGPSTNTITTVVNDGDLSTTNSFTVTVTEVNVAPVFVGTPTNRTVAELTTLTVTNNAVDADIPANTLTYSLQNGPSGAAIDTNGVISWTPSEVQGAGTNTITTIVSDGLLSATNSFTVTVTEVNVAPVFVGTLTNLTVAELTTLTVTNNATDADVPANTLTYSLQNAPVGAAIDTNGVITWTPTESQGPGTNTITTIVSDGAQSATNSFVVVVTEVNSAPILPTQNGVVVAELTTLTVTNAATDADFPANVLTYQLINAPSGTSVSAAGVISWTPTEMQGPSTNTITTVVNDGALSVTNSFVVTVTEMNVAPVFVATPTNRTIAELTTLTVTNNA